MDRSKAIQSRLRISRGRCLRADRVDPAIPCRTRVDGSQESLLSPDRNRVVSCQLEGTEGLAPDSAEQGRPAPDCRLLPAGLAPTAGSCHGRAGLAVGFIAGLDVDVLASRPCRLAAGK